MTTIRTLMKGKHKDIHLSLTNPTNSSQIMIHPLETSSHLLQVTPQLLPIVISNPRLLHHLAVGLSPRTRTYLVTARLLEHFRDNHHRMPSMTTSPLLPHLTGPVPLGLPETTDSCTDHI